VNAPDLFAEAFDLGWAAGIAHAPLAVCPFGPGLESPEDAEDDRHQGWLYGWWEVEMERLCDVAHARGWWDAVEDRNAPAIVGASYREHEAYENGWIAGAVFLAEGREPWLH